jgi:hypothetical protein
LVFTYIELCRFLTVTQSPALCGQEAAG